MAILASETSEAVIQAWLANGFKKTEAFLAIFPKAKNPSQEAYNFWHLPDVKARSADVFEEWQEAVNAQMKARLVKMAAIPTDAEQSGQIAARDSINAQVQAIHLTGKPQPGTGPAGDLAPGVQLWIPAITTGPAAGSAPVKKSTESIESEQPAVTPEN
jgi:hypothetical protein